MTITITFSEPPSVTAWCTILDAVAHVYREAVLVEPQMDIAGGLVTTIEVPER